MPVNGVAKVKVYVDSLIGSLRLAFRAANIATRRGVCSDSPMLGRESPAADRGAHPKCAVPGCIDKPIAGCDVAAIDGPRADIVVTIMTTLVTFAYY
ncbi:hypothetical protein DBV15_05116 [Temnothorax longispinosus]|uniref:Uncharacterized protein n=1 Tax=Temnothorax longispinosus TaxID=300112 RepID=A0A4S2KU47_9HYME|nr:hypothetical protein DBV15_05116 [Temnothorax longispinosus]